MGQKFVRVVIAQRIGLAAIRHECQHFDAWVTQLPDTRSGAIIPNSANARRERPGCLGGQTARVS